LRGHVHPYSHCQPHHHGDGPTPVLCYQYLSKYGSNGSGNGQFDTIRGSVADAAGNNYVADLVLNRVQKFDASGNYLLQWAAAAVAMASLMPAYIVTVDPVYGNVYVTDANNSRVQVFDTNGKLPLPMGSFGTGNGQFNGISGIAVDTSGHVYVAEYNGNRVQKFDLIGTYLSQFGSAEPAAEPSMAPRASRWTPLATSTLRIPGIT